MNDMNDWLSTVRTTFAVRCLCGCELVAHALGEEVCCPDPICGTRWRVEGTVHIACKPAHTDAYPPDVLAQLPHGLWLGTPITGRGASTRAGGPPYGIRATH